MIEQQVQNCGEGIVWANSILIVSPVTVWQIITLSLMAPVANNVTVFNHWRPGISLRYEGT